MELEFQQIDLRYDHLRKRNPALERQLLASLDDAGQRVPVVVVAEQDHYVLLDGYKRLRALKRLRRDTVLATLWDLGEAEGLLLERLMRSSQPEGPLEQGWLLRELRDRFQMSMDELARRFDRTTSWVSRRLALVHALPEPVQDKVRAGRIAPHTAMKVLVSPRAVELIQAAAAAGKVRPWQVVEQAILTGLDEGGLDTAAPQLPQLPPEALEIAQECAAFLEAQENRPAALKALRRAWKQALTLARHDLRVIPQEEDHSG